MAKHSSRPKEKEEEVKTNSLTYYALKYVSSVTQDSEIQNIDMTPIFYAELDEMLKHKELINITINGLTRGGKSTEAIALALHVHQRAIFWKHFPKDQKFTIKNIARTQQEFDKMMRDANIQYTVIVTDEFTSVDETGQDVTTLQALRSQMSDVHAGRYVHKIMVSPKTILDDNSNIILEVIQRDNQKMMTRNWLYYRLFKGGNEYRQLLGYVDIYVGDLIKNWVGLSLERLFYKLDKTDKEKEQLLEWTKKDFYVEYMVKKYEKMELLTKEKIFRDRDMDYAEVILKVVNELIPLTKLGFITKDIVESYTIMYARRMDIPQSIIGSKLLSEKVYSILKFWETFWKLNKELDHLELLKSQNKVSETTYQAKHKELIEMRDKIVEAVTQLHDEYKHMVEVRDKFMVIESEK